MERRLVRGYVRFCETTCRKHLDDRVVIRYTAGIETSGWDENVDLGPVPLQTPWANAINANSSTKFADAVAEQNLIAILKSEVVSVFLSHEDIVPHGPGYRVFISMDDAVELLATAGGEEKLTLGHPF